ncbi:MAG: hypothetical protein DRG83_07210 [Deltaproteobacteria bacterium]|nr:MAG: hypothetical protein DRG83_07210 [Deltaproteobacteria bacterium]
MNPTKDEVRDYFIAVLNEEDDSLEMEPHCGRCDAHLNEDYYCENCRRNCLCLDIYCKTEVAYKKVTRLLSEQEQFKKFRAFKGLKE